MAELRGLCSTQRIVLYQTKSRLYLVGSNNAETRFRVLKIDRTEPKDLVIIDDKVEYSQRQIKELLSMINAGNITRNNKGYDNTTRGLHRSMSAYGILGFVKFLEGYYIIVITERRKEAQIGGHTIYKIEDTQMIPIPNEVVRQKYQHPDEGRYVKIFQNVDLSSNFYFSYSYDLTLTLQQSLAPLLQPRTPPKTCTCNVVRVGNTRLNESSCCYDSTATSSSAPNDVDSSDTKREPEVESLVSSTSSYLSAQSQQLGCESPRKETSFQFEQGKVRELVEDNSLPMNAVKTTMSAPYVLDRKFGACQKCRKNRTQDRRSKKNKVKACYKFVWNKYLLRDFEGVVHSDWVLHIINGFVGQSDICVYMRPIYVTVIARRSAEFAGTRFLKRGANDQGYVANEVETEQIVHDASVISLSSGRFTSYVQLRGSVPSFWSQDVNKGIVPKPQIMVDRSDPYCLAASQHFNQLLKRYGAPVVILNLVKKKEKRRHEQILSEELQQIVEYLNQFLPPDLAIKYIGWDMSRTNKSKGSNVIQKLTGIADEVFKMTGFFHSGPELYCNKLRKDSRCEGMRGTGYSEENMGRQQNGVLRVNCVDCLDRTNTAQFMVGKCALGFQLYTLGVIDKPIVRFDSDVVRILEDLYEAHGDTIALQYGGSQLVHGIRTYRKVSPFTSHTRDIMQTVSRYYSNAFNDADKQQAMNLFLGVFVPKDRKPRLWELPTDYYLHHNSTRDVKALKDATSYTKWCSPMVIKSLPHSVFEAHEKNYEKVNDDFTEEQTSDSVGSDEESGDIFSEYYRPYELSKFDRLHAQVMQKSCRDFRPSNTADPSPFVMRAPRNAPSRRPVPVRKAVGAAPGMGADDSSDSDDSSDDEGLMAQSTKKTSDACSTTVSFQDLLPSMKDIYGIGLREPQERSLDSYDRFLDFSRTAEQDPERKVAKHIVYNWKKNRPFSFDSCRQVKPPSVERRSRVLYGACIQSLEYHTITADSLGSYKGYVSKQWCS